MGGHGLGINTSVHTVVWLHTQDPGSCVTQVSETWWTTSPKHTYNPEGAWHWTMGGLLEHLFYGVSASGVLVV